jgi:hypothetical protein
VVTWILFVAFCAYLHFGPYSYSYLRIGSDREELTDNQDYPEDQEDFEEMPGSRPSTN